MDEKTVEQYMADQRKRINKLEDLIKDAVPLLEKGIEMYRKIEHSDNMGPGCYWDKARDAVGKAFVLGIVGKKILTEKQVKDALEIDAMFGEG